MEAQEIRGLREGGGVKEKESGGRSGVQPSAPPKATESISTAGMRLSQGPL